MIQLLSKFSRNMDHSLNHTITNLHFVKLYLVMRSKYIFPKHLNIKYILITYKHFFFVHYSAYEDCLIDARQGIDKVTEELARDLVDFVISLKISNKIQII